MLLDGCYCLERLLKLYDHFTKAPSFGEVDKEMEDNRLAVVLTDLTLLENQIPFVVILKLYSVLFKRKTTCYKFPGFERVAKSLFDFDCSANQIRVFHFLHFMHILSPDNKCYGEVKYKKATQELRQCAVKLKASGITITSSGNVGSVGLVSKFLDRFDFDIKYDNRELRVPSLHIKRGTEERWRNLIALEQSENGVGYKFTSYALFFKGLICCGHDIELLKQEKVIVVDDPEVKDEDLLAMFRKMANVKEGVEQMDCRYSKVCNDLHSNSGTVKFFVPRLWWHYCRRVLEWFRKELKKSIQIFIKEYIPNFWAFLGVVAATILLALTILQTYYVVRDNNSSSVTRPSILRYIE